MFNLLDFARSLASTASSDELGQVMARAAAPVFLLGAVAAFISVLTARLSRIVDRMRVINRVAQDDHDRLFLKADIPRLQQRAERIHRAILLSLLSGLATTFIVIFMFGAAFVGIVHEWGAAILFIAAQTLFAASLVYFAMELRVGLSDLDNYE